jgi:hypothetical protein
MRLRKTTKISLWISKLQRLNTILISRVRSSVTNNNEFWFGWLDLLTASYNHTTRTYRQYRTIADLHASQLTVVHTLGFSVPTSLILATDLNIGTITSNHYEVCLPFLVQSPWTADSLELGPIVQFYLQFRGSWLCTHQWYRSSTDHAENTSTVAWRGPHINTTTVARIVVLPSNEL